MHKWDNMEAFEQFSGKLEQLLKKHATIEADNKRLRATIDGQNKAIQRLNQKVRTMEANMVSVHIGKEGLDDEEKADMRRQLDTVIDEIDKILLKLND